MGKSKLINNLDSIVKEPLIIEGLEMNTGNEILKETRNLPELCKLFGECWVEGEICVLVGDTNVGKTILAMQIALCIADPVHYAHSICSKQFSVTSEPQMVLFFNFELSKRKIRARFTEGQSEFIFPDNFRIISFLDYTKNFKKGIEGFIKKTGAKVIIIDNLSRFQAYGYSIENSDDAVKLIQWFESLQKDYDLSILLVHHPAKKKPYYPWSINDLSGSKKIANMIRSCIALGDDISGAKNERYLVQLKVTDTDYVFTKDNVATWTIDKTNNRLQMQYVGQGKTEMSCLKINTESTVDRNETILRLWEEGLSLRDIANRCGLSHEQVRNIVKRFGGVKLSS